MQHRAPGRQGVWGTIYCKSPANAAGPFQLSSTPGLPSEELSADIPVSLILQRVAEGEVRAAEELLPLVYNELRRLAAARMQHEST